MWQEVYTCITWKYIFGYFYNAIDSNATADSSDI